jgi:catechol 2,3-dioxygenase-like lactoylglutathione lyase family enzyme
VPFGPFLGVKVANDVTLDFMDADAKEPAMQHYAFQIDEADFDRIFARIQERRLPYWADPGRTEQGRINTYNGGRGFYFQDPSGHLLEVLTRP